MASSVSNLSSQSNYESLAQQCNLPNRMYMNVLTKEIIVKPMGSLVPGFEPITVKKIKEYRNINFTASYLDIDSVRSTMLKYEKSREARFHKIFGNVRRLFSKIHNKFKYGVFKDSAQIVREFNLRITTPALPALPPKPVKVQATASKTDVPQPKPIAATPLQTTVAVTTAPAVSIPVPMPALKMDTLAPIPVPAPKVDSLALIPVPAPTVAKTIAEELNALPFQEMLAMIPGGFPTDAQVSANAISQRTSSDVANAGFFGFFSLTSFAEAIKQAYHATAPSLNVSENAIAPVSSQQMVMAKSPEPLKSSKAASIPDFELLKIVSKFVQASYSYFKAEQKPNSKPTSVTVEEVVEDENVEKDNNQLIAVDSYSFINFIEDLFSSGISFGNSIEDYKNEEEAAEETSTSVQVVEDNQVATAEVTTPAPVKKEEALSFFATAAKCIREFIAVFPSVGMLPPEEDEIEIASGPSNTSSITIEEVSDDDEIDDVKEEEFFDCEECDLSECNDESEIDSDDDISDADFEDAEDFDFESAENN